MATLKAAPVDARGRADIDALSWQEEDRLRDHMTAWLEGEQHAGMTGSLTVKAQRWLRL